jgi:hypothetical protein
MSSKSPSSKSTSVKKVPCTYRVVLLPKQEVAAQGLSLREAQTWVQAYNHVMRDFRRQAVIAEELPRREAA